MGLLWCLLSVTASFGNRLWELPSWGCDDVQIIVIINTAPAGMGKLETRTKSPVREVKAGNEILPLQRWASPCVCALGHYCCPFPVLGPWGCLAACWLWSEICWDAWISPEEGEVPHMRRSAFEPHEFLVECDSSREKSGQSSHGFPHIQVFTAGCHCD